MIHFETIAVHAGAEPDPATGAVAPPIHLSTTFEHGPASEDPFGYHYVRDANPTQARLETALAALEQGEAALVWASGMAATGAYLQALPPGSHVVFPDDMYYANRIIARDLFPRWGLTSTAVDGADLAAIEAAMTPATRLVWAETPSNPLMKVVDLRSWPSWPTPAGRSCSWTGPSPRPRCSSRWPSAPTSCCTPPPSTSAATATCRAARSSSSAGARPSSG